MLHVKDEDTATPQVNWANKTANCRCEVCETEKNDFPLYSAVRFNGDSFIFMSNMYGCGCEYTTVYPLAGDHPMCIILGKMAGMIPME